MLLVVLGKYPRKEWKKTLEDREAAYSHGSAKLIL